MYPPTISLRPQVAVSSILQPAAQELKTHRPERQGLRHSSNHRRLSVRGCIRPKRAIESSRRSVSPGVAPAARWKPCAIFATAAKKSAACVNAQGGALRRGSPGPSSTLSRSTRERRQPCDEISIAEVEAHTSPCSPSAARLDVCVTRHNDVDSSDGLPSYGGCTPV